MITDTASMIAEYAQTMGLVNHDRAVVLVLQFHNLGELGQVAFHGEYTINNYQLYGIIRQPLENLLQILHVIVLKLQLLCKTEAATVNDTCMVAIITDDIVFTSTDSGNDACINRETGREAQGIILVYKLCQIFLQLNVNVKRTIEETTAGTSRAVLINRSLGCLTNTVITNKSCIGIRAKHQYLVTSHGDLGSLLTGNLAEIGVNTHLHKALRQTI